MSTSTLPNIRVSSDLTVRLKLKDGGVAVDWTTLTNIRASIFSDAQRAKAGRCDVSIDETDHTVLVCEYSANKPQYLGVNRVIVSCTYEEETKTYDKPAFTFVRWTDDQAGQSITIDDPDIDVEITVEDISSSILQEAVEAANSAAERANDAAAAAEHMVDIHTGPAGKSPYIGENGHWYEWDEETSQYVDTEEEAQGEPGVTPDITIGTVTTAEPGTPAAATMTGTPEAPVLNLTIPKGVAGDTPAFTVGEVTTGQPGTPVVVTITGTAAAPVLNIQIPQGMQGNTGSSVDYPYELVNNLTTNDATKGLTAAQGKVLKDELGQLEAEVHTIAGRFYGVFEDEEDLPEGTNNGYAFVGASEPFAIYNFIDGEWEDSGSEAVGIQGPQGNSGYTGAVGELEVVNNLEDGGATAALSAEAGKLLARNMKLLYDSMGAAAFWGEKPVIDWSGNSVPVSLTLTDCTIDNLSANVPLGDSYEATITPDAGNILGTVVCTMNGEPQTVVNGHIEIVEVTGAIVISAEGININSEAFDGKSYKTIFETNNALGISPGFENGSYSPLVVGAGAPTVVSTEKDSGTYSLECTGASSQQLKLSSTTTSTMFLACRVKITAYTAGNCGIQSAGAEASAGEVTDWVTKTANRTATTNSNVFVGSMNSADLTGYIDTPVAVKKSTFSTVPTLDKWTELYENYVKIKKSA